MWYEKAVTTFEQLGDAKRQARVHCNLGSVKMRLRDLSGMAENEKAIELNPKDGTAHMNIGLICYGGSEPGDYRHVRALDAFADAIVADPQRYGPKVIAFMEQVGYTWKEDFEQVSQKAADKLRLAASGDAPAFLRHHEKPYE